MIIDCLAWVLRICAEGVWPKHNYYGKPWDPTSWRAALGGKPLFGGKHGVLCEVGVDLDAFNLMGTQIKNKTMLDICNVIIH